MIIINRFQKKRILNIHNAKCLFFLLRMTIGILFVLSGIGKLIDISSFSNILGKFSLLPQELIFTLSICIPVIEVLFGIALITGMVNKLASIGLAVMLILFLIAIGKIIADGTPMDCGCGGVIASDPIGPMLFFKDIGLLIIIVMIYAFNYNRARDPKFCPLEINIWLKIIVYIFCFLAAYQYLIL